MDMDMDESGSVWTNLIWLYVIQQISRNTYGM